MNYKLNIPNAFSRKVICVTLVLVVSLSLLAGGALADTCHGGTGCLNCAESMHPQLPGMDEGMMVPHGCRQPLIPDSSCSFEASPGPDKFHAIIPSVDPVNFETGSIYISISDNDPSPTAGAFLSQTLYFGAGRSTPIFLINQSLLC